MNKQQEYYEALAFTLAYGVLVFGALIIACIDLFKNRNHE